MKAGVCASGGRLHRGAQFPAELPFLARGASIQILQSDVIFGACGGVGTLRRLAYPGSYPCTWKQDSCTERATRGCKEMKTHKIIAATKNGDF